MKKEKETTQQTVPQTVPDIEPYTGGGRKEKVSVNQFGLDGKWIKTFASQYEAEKQTKVSSASISMCITGKQKSAGGWQWKKA